MASIVLKTMATCRHNTIQLVGRTFGRYQIGINEAKLATAKHTAATLDDESVGSYPMDTTEPLKPFSEMPGPKGLPYIGTMWDYMKKGGFSFNKLFLVFEMRAKQYGRIYKENFGAGTSVVVSDPIEYAKVMRGDGRCPHRTELGPLLHYRQKRGMSLGAVNSQGVEWYRHRAVLNKLLLPREALEYLKPMNEVASDFVSRLSSISGANDHIDNIEMELFRWAMESIGTVLFEERIGCFKDPPPPEAHEFIVNLVGYFRTMQRLMYSMPIYMYFPTKVWRIHERHADKIVEIGQHYVNKKLEEVSRQKKTGEKINKSVFLTYLLQQKSLTPQEVNGHVIDLLMGAVETVSNSLLWTLYCLATNPETQEALYAEVDKVMTNETEPNLNDMHYLKACVKEMYRLYPVAFTTSRIIPESLELGGYEVPAGSHMQANLYGMGRDPTYFPEPLRYLPDRWMRETEDDDDELNRKQQLICGLAFGHGARMCLGRRFAEQEMYIVLSKLIHRFRFEYIGPTPNPTLNTVMTPDIPLQFTITPRTGGRPTEG